MNTYVSMTLELQNVLDGDVNEVVSEVIQSYQLYHRSPLVFNMM